MENFLVVFLACFSVVNCYVIKKVCKKKITETKERSKQKRRKSHVNCMAIHIYTHICIAHIYIYVYCMYRQKYCIPCERKKQWTELNWTETKRSGEMKRNEMFMCDLINLFNLLLRLIEKYFFDRFIRIYPRIYTYAYACMYMLLCGRGSLVFPLVDCRQNNVKLFGHLLKKFAPTTTSHISVECNYLCEWVCI